MTDTGVEAEPVMKAQRIMEVGEAARMIEALLFAAAEPLSEADLVRRLPASADVAKALEALKFVYASRGVELACVAGRWRSP